MDGSRADTWAERNVEAPELTASDWIDRENPSPLYHQIYLVMRQRILGGYYQPGDRIRPEAELEREFGVSRITVRRALDELSRAGLIERQQGRTTRVLARPRIQPLTGSAENELQNTLEIGLATRAQVLKCEVVSADAQVAEALMIARGEPVYWIERVRRRDNLPFCFTRAFVPQHRLPDDFAGDLAETPLVVLLERSGATLKRVEQTITAIPASAKLAHWLEVSDGAPLLQLERQVFDEGDRPVQYVTAVFRPDRYRYRLALGAV